MESLTSVVSHVTLCRQIVDIIDVSATSSSEATAAVSMANGASSPGHAASGVVTRTTCTADESTVSRRRSAIVMLTLSDVETIRRNVVSLQRHHNKMTSQLIDSRRQVERYSKQLKTLQAAASQTAAVVMEGSCRPSTNIVTSQPSPLTYLTTPPPSATVAATLTAVASPIPATGAAADGSVGLRDDSAVRLGVSSSDTAETSRTTSESRAKWSRLLEQDHVAAERHVRHRLAAVHSLAGEDPKSSSQTSVADTVGVSLQPRPLPRNAHESHAERVQSRVQFMSAAAASSGNIAPPSGIVNKLIAQNSRLQQALRDVVTERYGSVDNYLTLREYDDVIVQLRDDIKQLRRKNSQLQSLLAAKCGLSAAAEDLAQLKCSRLSDQVSSEGDFKADDKHTQKTPVGEILAAAQLTSKTSSLVQVRDSAVESCSDSDVCRSTSCGGGVTDDAQNAVSPFLSCSRCEREFPCSEMLQYLSHCLKCCD